ncbi:universal stress protein [Amycolatopsis sp. lyj-108]|uniref:universal stress protein n=1 Tax=Amycolatopsis sp. lyj-108 TaxID=2789286 RepID=UPI00397AE6B6
MPVATERSIVVGIDGSQSAKAAAMWAGREASRRGLSLRLVHVFTMPVVTMPGVIPASEGIRESFESRGLEWVSEVREAVLAQYPELVIESAVRQWSPVAALIQESVRASMVVLGSRGLGGFTGMLVGSIAVALAHHGHCPIVVARGPQAEGGGPVVVGTDGSSASDAALAFAFDEARLHDTGLTVVRTWSELLDHGALRPHFLDVDPVEIEGAERLAVEEQVAPWRDKYPDVPVEVVVRKGRPVRILLESAEGARLLVVGSRGRGGFEGMLLGSTSQALIAHSECPVAVVRPAVPGGDHIITEL